MIVLSEGLWRQRFSADPAVLGTARPSRWRGLHRRRRAAGRARPTRIGRRAPSFRTPFDRRPATIWRCSMRSRRCVPASPPAQAAAEGTARGRLAADTGMTTIGDLRQQRSDRDHGAAAARRVDRRCPPPARRVAGRRRPAARDRHRERGEPAARARDHEDPRDGDSRGARCRQRARHPPAARRKPAARARRRRGRPRAWRRCCIARCRRCCPPTFRASTTLGVDAAVLAFALVVSVGTSIVCGLLPALRARRLNLVEALAEDGTAPVGAGVRIANGPRTNARSWRDR